MILRRPMRREAEQSSPMCKFNYDKLVLKESELYASHVAGCIRVVKQQSAAEKSENFHKSHPQMRHASNTS